MAINFNNVTDIMLGQNQVTQIEDSLGNVLWSATPADEYFYVEDISGSSNTLSIVKREDSAPTIEVFCSTDRSNWTSMGQTSTTPITATIPANGKLYLKCTANSWGAYPNSSTENIMSASGNHNVGGNIMSLLRGDNFFGATLANDERLSDLFLWDDFLISAGDLYLPPNTVDDCFRGLFFGCTSLTTPPALPAKRMYWQCYKCMFYGCTSLTTAPALPAETLAEGCYDELFRGCTSLTTAPALPATTLAQSCYSHMFQGCTSLTTAPALPATTLANYCYYEMFQNCASLTTTPSLPATTLAQQCYSNMFNSCTHLTTAPALPATTLAIGCYSNMFSGCTSLTTAPALPATTLVSNCYAAMFAGCTSLTSVITYANDISATSCLNNWLNGVAATGDFYNLGGATYVSGANGIPAGWTEHTSL